jgi:hypothetical protein
MASASRRCPKKTIVYQLYFCDLFGIGRRPWVGRPAPGVDRTFWRDPATNREVVFTPLLRLYWRDIEGRLDD